MRIILISAAIVSSQGSERSFMSYQFRSDKVQAFIIFYGEKCEQRISILESGMQRENKQDRLKYHKAKMRLSLEEIRKP